MKGLHIHPPSLKLFERICSGVALLLLFGAMRTFGATITVTNANDAGAGSLRAAIDSAANGDTINFSLAYPATITLNTPLTLGPSVTITGPGASNLAISGGDSVVVWIVNAGATAAISGLTIEHGSNLLGGGITNFGTLTLTGCVISNNILGNQLGGGIFNAGILSLTSSTVSGNSVGVSNEEGIGGGIYNYGQGTLTLTNSTVSGNTAGSLQLGFNANGIGGGIYNDQGTVTLTNSTVSQNTAVGPAGTGLVGGIVSNRGSLTLVGSTVSGNQSDDGSGGIDASGALSLLNSTISGNSVGSAANPSCGGFVGGTGGIRWTGNTASDLFTLSFTTVSGNVFYSNGPLPCAAGIFVRVAAAQSPVVKNSILANNSANNSQGDNCETEFGPIASGGYNQSDDATCASYFTQTGDLNSTPAGLDPGGLKNNGGPTQTIALLATSPAVNAIPLSACTDASGSPVTTDQRGVRRPQGTGCDIGAYEYFQSRNLNAAVQTYGLIAAVQSTPLTPLPKLGLTVELQAAVDFENRGNNRLAIGELNLFDLSVNVLVRARALTPQQGSTLTTPAQAIIQTLSDGGGGLQ